MPEQDEKDGLRPDGRKWGSFNDSERFEDLVRQRNELLLKRKQQDEQRKLRESTGADEDQEE